jgi:hypothetical protein
LQPAYVTSPIQGEKEGRTSKEKKNCPASRNKRGFVLKRSLLKVLGCFSFIQSQNFNKEKNGGDALKQRNRSHILALRYMVNPFRFGTLNLAQDYLELSCHADEIHLFVNYSKKLLKAAVDQELE